MSESGRTLFLHGVKIVFMKMHTSFQYFLFALVIFFCLSFDGYANTQASGDSVKISHVPHRYFRPTVYTNGYTTPQSIVKTKPGNEFYSYSHFNSGYLLPVFTDSWFRNDGVTLSNFHILMSGNMNRAFADYSAISLPYSFYKVSVGARAIYNTGNKNIWFVNVSPFFSQDDKTFGKPVLHYSTLLVFNRTVSRNFSYRLGYDRTYILGGKKVDFPLLGIRIGPLDGAYISIQFPQYAAFNFPMGEKFRGALFVRPSGSMFNFSEFNGRHDVIQFRRYEFLYGYMMSYRASRNLGLNLGSGFCRNRNISFSDEGKSKTLIPNAQPVSSSLFFTAGITVRFGRSISIHNNLNMYDAFDLNYSLDADNNESMSNNDIPSSKDRVIKNIQYRDIMDLLDEDDLY